MTEALEKGTRPRWKRPFRLFKPILAGATLRDRLIACLGALAGIALTGLLSALLIGHGPHIPFIVAPMGASAVLLFAVPASPMAQPWPIIGGNVVSALVGIAVAKVVPDQTLAIGLAVALSIGCMSILRCLHPPGGAAALTSVIGGPAVAAAGFMFPFVPVALNAISLVALGWLFHKLSRHSYPHVAKPAAPPAARVTTDVPPTQRVGFRAEDVDSVLEQLGEAFDISREDLELLLREVEARALVREYGDLSCADIMSRDIIRIGQDADPEIARRLLLEHGVRLLPVLDEHGRVVGSVGLRELARSGRSVAELMAEAVTAKPDEPAIGLSRPLTDGRHHAVVIVDDDRHLVGLVTQTDLLAAMSRRLERASA